MHTIRKLLLCLLASALIFSLSACGGAKGNQAVAEAFGLDLESTKEQPMSEQRGERDAIYTAVKGHFGDVTFFSSDSPFAKMTYEDLKELIGVDATYYYYDEDAAAQTFVWETCDYKNAKVAFFFRFDELYARSAINMKDY